MTTDGFIGFPPGMEPPSPDTDSSTVKHRRPERPEIVFLPAVPGAPPPPVPGSAVPGAAPAAATTPPIPAVETVPTWRLRIPGIADAVEIDSAVVLGRNPSAPPEAASAVAVPIHDPAKSVSKTHALFEVVGGRLMARDLDSTNGVWIRVPTAEPRRIEPGESVEVPSGADLELGEFVVRVEFG
jgi:hypothetical protein